MTLDPQKICEKLEHLQNKKINLKSDLIIFDEIQACPLALTSLKYFCEEQEQAFICAAGSLLGLYSEEPSFPVGKVSFLNIYPMGFEEFLLALGKENLLYDYIKNPDEFTHEKLWIDFKDYLFVGGLPEVVKTYVETKDFSLVSEIHDVLINGYIADMAKHCGKENAMFLQRLWQNSAEKIGQNQSEKFKFKGVFPGKKTFLDFAGPIDWLTKAGLIHLIPILDQINQPLSLGRKENAFKIFNFDVGVLNHLKGISITELREFNFNHKGFIAENFFLQEAQLWAPKTKFYSYQKGESEIEFLFEKEGKLFPLEIKAGSNLKAKSLSLFLQKNPKANAIRLSKKIYSQKGSSKSPITDFPLFMKPIF
jgi:predicted AAA+ superfamily ATPase